MPQNWEAAYQEALLETDRQKLAGKIPSVIAVLQYSLAELDSSPEHLRERQLISDALRTLHMIRRLEIQSSAPMVSA
jgi:hypothetical protein